MSDLETLAAHLFPVQWARAVAGPHASKKKRQLRQRAQAAQKVAALSAAGHTCGDCAAFHATGPCGAYCELDTDFHGYARTTADDLCPRWRKA